MDLRQLEYFAQAAKSGSFSAAAKRMYVTQQAISAAVSNLERELDLALFERRASGVVLTEFGEHALESAERIIEASHRLQADASDYRSTFAGTVGFAYASAALPIEGEPFSLQSLRAFSRMHPQVNLLAFENSSDACLAALEHGTADLAFVAGEPDAGMFDAVKVADASFMVAIAKNHPLASRDQISFSDLEGVEIFPPPDLNLSVRAITNACEAYGFSPRYALASFSVENARAFVREGRGVDFTPAHLAQDDLDGVAFRPLKPEDDIAVGLYVASLSTAQFNAGAAVLKSFILECYESSRAAASGLSAPRGAQSE